MCSAIYHHDDKLAVDGPMDEVLKDADVIHHCMNDISFEIIPWAQETKNSKKFQQKNEEIRNDEHK